MITKYYSKDSPQYGITPNSLHQTRQLFCFQSSQLEMAKGLIFNGFGNMASQTSLNIRWGHCQRDTNRWQSTIEFQVRYCWIEIQLFSACFKIQQRMKKDILTIIQPHSYILTPDRNIKNRHGARLLGSPLLTKINFNPNLIPLGKVIIYPVQCGRKLPIHSQAPTVAPLKFVSG